MIDRLKAAWKFVVTDHGTKTLGFLQVTVGALTTVPGLFPTEHLPKVLAISGLLTAWRGFVNSGKP